MRDWNSSAEENLVPRPLRRFIPVIGALAMGLALFGFLRGIREPRPVLRETPKALVTLTGATDAVNYRELQNTRLKPDPLAHQTLRDLRSPTPGIFDPVVRTDEMKLAAIADRSRNRAYDGAPPTIPHPVEPRSTSSCLLCHEAGLKVGDRVASRMCHSRLTNCTQCHVEQRPMLGEASTPGVETTFVGVYRAGPGDRASPGAPPWIPHNTWMRENCESCHGLVTRAGTRTTHPWLTNCKQCHAPSATLDQAPRVAIASQEPAP